MKTIEVCDYSDFRTYLKDCFEKRKNQNKHFSYAQWAKELELGGTAVLTNILNGKRFPGKSVGEKLAQNLELNPNQVEYFFDLINLQRFGESDTRLAVLLMEKLSEKSTSKFQFLDDRIFSSISKWYYYAIREMVSLPNFNEDTDALVKELRFKVTASEVKKAISDLLELGLLKRLDDGKLVISTQNINTQTDVADEGLKRFHSSMIDHAKESIRSVDVLERDITSMTLNVKLEDLARAKDFIKKFRRNFLKHFENSAGDETYQLNVQLFPLTQTKKNKNTKLENL